GRWCIRSVSAFRFAPRIGYLRRHTGETIERLLLLLDLALQSGDALLKCLVFLDGQVKAIAVSLPTRLQILERAGAGQRLLCLARVLELLDRLASLLQILIDLLEAFLGPIVFVVGSLQLGGELVKVLPTLLYVVLQMGDAFGRGQRRSR